MVIVERRRFGQMTLMDSVNSAKNHNLRVMSTPQWPVPYYQRAFRHPANLDRPDGDITYINVPLHDSHAMIAKEMLKMNGQGYVVEAIENHYKIDSYLT